MYNWRILLGGVASAGILTVGIAGPALAQSVSRTDILPASSLTGVIQGTGGSAAAGVLCDLPGLPMAGPVDSAVAGVLGAPCGSSSTTGGMSSGPTGAGSPVTGARDAANAANAASGARDATSAASGAASMLPGLSSVSSVVPGLSAVTSGLSGLTTVTGAGSLSNLPGASTVTGALSGLGGTSGGA